MKGEFHDKITELRTKAQQVQHREDVVNRNKDILDERKSKVERLEALNSKYDARMRSMRNIRNSILYVGLTIRIWRLSYSL